MLNVTGELGNPIMQAVTIERVLHQVRKFEDMLATFYGKFSRDNPHEGVRLLTHYMSRHSHHIQDYLSKLPVDEVDRILKVPLSYEPHIPDCHCFDEIDLPADADAAHVLDLAVILDECLMQLYCQVVRQPIEHQVRELFEGLIQILEQDEIQLKKIKAMNYF